MVDLKKDISFKKKVSYPSKTTINLVQEKDGTRSTAMELALFGIFIVILLVLCKFFVIDPIQQATESGGDLSSAQSQLAALQAENEIYADISDEYSKYVVSGLTDAEQNLADREQLMDLLRTTVLSQAPYLQTVQVTGNVVSLTCVGVTLQDLSGLVASLEADPRVAYVTVSTAVSRDGGTSSATIEFQMKGALDSSATSLIGGGATNGQ